MQKRPHPIRVGLEIRSLPTLRERLRRTQAIKLLAKEGRLCWYSNTLLGYCVKIGMLPAQCPYFLFPRAFHSRIAIAVLCAGVKYVCVTSGCLLYVLVLGGWVVKQFVKVGK
ncbi:hypothetical protein NIES22_05520 [Calothrix brevissima NIES-22]|nr:hypothetical protein NIES22_05520 [Calothrix brevissima NIES-22]